VILVGAMGTIYKDYTDKPHWQTLITINLKKLTNKLNEHSIRHEKENEKTTQAVKVTPHINGKGATLVPSTVKLLHCEKEKKNQWGSRGLQAWPETGSP